MLSKRGEIAAHNALRPDFELFFEAAENVYDAKDNPGGNFLLNVAENKLCWPILQKKLKEITSQEDIPDWVFGYTNANGSPEFRSALAGLYEHFFVHDQQALSPDAFVVLAGATAIIEATTFCLGDTGDVALIPSPCYTVYTQDIGIKAGLQRYDMPFPNQIGATDFSISYFENAWKEVTQSGRKVACVILTNPNNPTGQILTLEELEVIADWCIQKEIHLIVNEIYGLSLLNRPLLTNTSQYSAERHWTSFINLIESRQSPYLHHWYALSKDFGVSGFRVGVLYSRNETLIQAVTNIAAPHMVSNHTQWMWQLMLEDQDFVTQFVDQNQRLLTQSYQLVINTLEECDVPYVPAYGSLFVWIDLSRFMRQDSLQGERELWREVFAHTGVLLTPGEGFGHSSFGHFRLVYTAVTYDDLVVAMKRLKSYWLGAKD